MYTRSLVLIGCVVCIGLFRYASATYGEKCTTDSDCTTNDHTTCQTVHDDCPSKGCTGCATGYEMNYLGTACTASMGTACSDVDADCLVNAAANGACTGGVCACAGSYTYDTALRGCTEDTKAKFGATCTTVADCHVVALGNGACTGGSCACATGYVQGDGYSCREPIYDEACVDVGSGGVACEKQTSDTSDNIPTCQSGKCKCESTHEQKTILGVTVCLTAKTDTIDNGLTCTAHNECTSKFCYSCPGTAADAICVGASSNNHAATIGTMSHPLVVLVVALIAGVMQM